MTQPIPQHSYEGRYKFVMMVQKLDKGRNTIPCVYTTGTHGYFTLRQGKIISSEQPMEERYTNDREHAQIQEV